MNIDFNKMLEQVQQMQGQMQQAQEELKNETVEATAGGGMVKVTATGGGEIREIKIDPKAIDPDDPEMLEDLVLAAVNEAPRTARVRAKTSMRCLALDRSSFRRLVTEHPAVAASLLEIAFSRLAENAGPA